MLYAPNKYRETEGITDQQNSIDKLKGVIAKPMPEYWYSIRDNNANAKNVSAERQKLNTDIIAPHKPYFMVYVYPTLKTEINKWVRDCNYDSARKFGAKSSDELNGSSENEKLFLEYRQKGFETGSRPCTVNRICWIFEKEFPNASVSKPAKEFNYEILKCDTDYSEKDFNIIRNLYLEYKSELDAFRQQVRTNGYDKNDDLRYNLDTFKEKFRGKCYAVCPNKQELCNIILDLCYTKECLKQFAWDIVGDVIVENLIEKKGSISFPVRNGTEFEFGGKTFDMVTIKCSDKGVVEE